MFETKTSCLFNFGDDLHLPPNSWLLWCLLFLLGYMPANAQQMGVTARLDSTHLLIGQQMQVALEVNHPVGSSVQFPAFTDTLTRSIEILEMSTRDTFVKADGFAQIIQRLTITSFDSGYHIIPPIPFFIKNTDESTDTLQTNPLGLEILLVPVDTTQAIKPIKEPADIPYTLRDVLPWILSGLLLAAVAFGVYLYFKKRKKPETAAVRSTPKEAPHVIAMRALAKLKDEQLWQSGELKAYHSKLTDIIREYIEHRFQIHTIERTSDEILTSLGTAGLAKQIPFANLQQILHQADLVKFAKGKPLPEDNVRSLEIAYDFVKQTMKKELIENGALKIHNGQTDQLDK